jgi:predicted MPP superfamily phosphohydrolase
VKLVLISDLHERPASVPAGDVLVLAGDVFCGDDRASLQSDLAWVASLKFKCVLMALGNHDLVLSYLLRTAPETAHSLLSAAGVTLLRDSNIVVDGIKFHGVDWRSTAAIPKADVLISHCPAKGVLDQRHPPKSEHLGDAGPAKQVALVTPRLVVSGHIHGGYGRVEQAGTTFVNCSLANEARQTANKPWVVEI